MTKGRQNAPLPIRDGIWFRHRGADNSDVPLERGVSTSTGRMLSAPFSWPDSCRPRPPPESFKSRARPLYNSANPFSTHDNRNMNQEKGEYFGDGRSTRTLGKLLHRDQCLHATGPDQLKHFSLNPTNYDYLSETSRAFTGRPISDPPTRRRFPKGRAEPACGSVPLDTTTTDWFKDLTGEQQRGAQSSTRVLANSQQPYPPHNPWKYSYKGLPSVYPPFHPAIHQVPATVDNILNRYGAAYKSNSAVEPRILSAD